MEITSEIADTVLQKIDSSMLLVEEFSGGKHLRKHVASLKDPMRSIQGRLKESHMWMTMREKNAEVKEWLKSVRSILYEIEDLAEHISALAAATDAGNRISVFRLKLNLRLTCGKMKLLTEKLKPFADKPPNVLSPDQLVGRMPDESTQSADSEVFLIGRNEDRITICNLLKEPEFSVVVISGMAGLGKTALAQSVFKDSGDQLGFNTRMWIWVGCELDESSIISRVDKEIAARKRSTSEGPIATPGKNKLLLVLDDVRKLKEENLNKMKTSLMSMFVSAASATIKIVITIRDDKLLTINDGYIPINRHYLGSISDQDAKLLFKTFALTRNENRVGVDNVDKFWDLGQEILKRTNNVHRIIKDMALILHEETSRRKWMAVMNAKFWCLREGYSPFSFPSIIALRLLPSPLKRCFMYSVLLHHHHSIEKRDLIHLWIAQGYITKKVSNDENQSHEEIAEEYYRALKDWSFFENPDLDLTLADHVAETEILSHHIPVAPDGSVSKVEPIDCKEIYHLFLSSTVNQSIAPSTTLIGDLIEFLPTQLRSFLKIGGSTLTLTTKFCETLFSKMGHLRSLDLNSSKILILPNSIGSLKNLKYLNLSLNCFKTLPESITALVKLQVLDLSDCEKLQKLPNHFYRLRKLRHLYINGCTCLARMPVGLGKMTLLQTLDIFILAKDQKSCKLDELSSLNLTSEPMYVFAPKPKTPLQDVRKH